MRWKSDRNKGFMVNDYYSLLVGSNDYCIPWKSTWKQKIPSRVALFLNCCFGKKLNNWQFMKKEGLDIGLVLYVQVWWWINWPSLPSLSGCYEFVVYDFGFVWSKLGYAAINCGSPSLLAKLAWSSSKWSYMDNCSPLFNVVSLKGKKIVGVLKIMRDPYKTSSYFF